MYKKNDLMSILDIVNDYPEDATMGLKDSLKDMMHIRERIRSFRGRSRIPCGSCITKLFIPTKNTNRDRRLLSRSCRSAGSKTNIMRSESIRKKISGKRFLSPRKRSKMEFMAFV